MYNQMFYLLLSHNINHQSIIDDFQELIYREIDYMVDEANAQH